MVAANNELSYMNALRPIAIITLLAAVAAIPFGLVASATILLASAIGCILQTDYSRHTRVRLPRRQAALQPSVARMAFGGEQRQLAA